MFGAIFYLHKDLGFQILIKKPSEELILYLENVVLVKFMCLVGDVLTMILSLKFGLAKRDKK
jgi:hypothetical protein